MIIADNMLANGAARQLKIIGNNKKRPTERLSSGYRINRASDDAAGLSISEKMRSQIRGLNQGTRNIQDGISVCQVMDGALNEVHDMLHRLTELSVEAANDTLTVEDRYAIQEEIDQLVSEINKTSENTVFNGLPLLSPIDREHSIVTTSGNADVIFVIDNTGSMYSPINNVINNLSSFTDTLADCNVRYAIVEFGDTDTTFNSSSFMTSQDDVKTRLRQISCSGGGDEPEQALEGIMKALDYSFRDDGATKEIILVTDASYHDKNRDGLSTLSDNQVARAVRNAGARLSVVTSSQNISLYQNNLANGKVLNISSDFHASLTTLAKDVSIAAGSIEHIEPKDLCIHMGSSAEDYMFIHTFTVNASTLGISNLNCITHEDANRSLSKIENALDKVSKIRSTIGADQNRLEHAFANNTNTSENTQTAESRLRDADMAKEVMGLSKQSILEQVGQSMITQANQNTQGVLKLLQ